MKVVSFVPSVLGVMTMGCEWWKDLGNGQDVGEQVFNNALLDVEF